MKITYTPNPLCSVIDLDERDVERLRLKLEIEELETRVYGAYSYLSGNYTERDPKKALEELRVDGLETEPLKRRIDEVMTWLVGDLRAHHDGDCICEPCSCGKCHAERLLGIDTIPGLGKHSANKIRSAFRDGRTIEEAIVWLQNYRPMRDHRSWQGLPKEEFERHVPRWTAEAQAALDWLRDYRQSRFS